MKLGINAARAKSGGAKNHLISILNNIDPLKFGFNEVHLWTFPEFVESIPKRSWLYIHTPNSYNKSIVLQLFWELFILYFIMKFKKFDVLLNVDAGSICRFNPSITMSRDMLAFEKGEISRLGLTFGALRQIFLKRIQCSSLRNSYKAIFLTRYASEVIQDCCGKIKNYEIIPHGVSKRFRDKRKKTKWPRDDNETIKVIYISPISLYKHQWKLVKAVSYLRSKNYKIKLLLVGSNEKLAFEKLKRELSVSDPNREFVTYLDEVSHSLIASFLSKSHIFCFASSCENMPNTLLEAMSIGIPIASSNKGPMPEILKDAGSYFDPLSSISISQALEKIIINKDFREMISKKAMKYSKEYTWERSANKLFSALSNLAKESLKTKI